MASRRRTNGTGARADPACDARGRRSGVDVECGPGAAAGVGVSGARVLFATQGKRPSVKGSRFASGARVFVARAGGPDVHVCESVVDSLSVATAAWGAPVGAAVIAAAGTSGLSAAAVSRWPGTVTVWAQGDGRTVRSDVAPAGMDWGEVAAQEADKRNALRKDAS